MKKLSISSFLTILISVLCIILTASTTILFTVVYRNSLQQTAIINSEQAVSQVTNTIEIYAQEMKNNLKMVEREIQWINTEEELRGYLNHMVQINSGCVSVMVYDETGRILQYGVNAEIMKDKQKDDMSFLPTLFSGGDYEISAPHVQNIFKGSYPWVATIGNKIYLELYGRELYVAMDVEVLSILSYVDNVSIGQRGYCFVMDQYGNMVYHPQQQLIYSGIKHENLEMLKNLDSETVVGDIIYSAQNLQDGHWTVVGVSYTDELVTDKIKELWWLIIVELIICIVILFISIRLFNRKIASPVQNLINAMKDFERNMQDFRYKKEKGVYEMQILSESFEHMVKRLQKLMERVKREEILLRKTELKALQTQINPHFLYNTLDSIQWMCERNKPGQAVKMVSALSKLFRISISKGKDLITVADEIEHAKNYMVIQTFRYTNQFTYRFDVEEKVLPYLCNKITLQPLIENAIIHGINPTFEDGEIVITAKTENNNVVFVVSDNGMGMSKEQCRSILKRDTNDNFGIGIKNVNDRNKIYFGNEYEIQIDSEMDAGTTITIKFPKMTKDNIKV
jgi:two-component system sensor histidine kinase YesM